MMHLWLKELIGSRLLHGDTLGRLMSRNQVSRKHPVPALYERKDKIWSLDYSTIGKSRKFWMGAKSSRVIEVDLRYTSAVQSLCGCSNRLI